MMAFGYKGVLAGACGVGANGVIRWQDGAVGWPD